MSGGGSFGPRVTTAVPLPDESTVLLTRPTAEEAQLTAEGVAAAAADPGGLTEVQRMLLEALFPAMTEHEIDVDAFRHVTPEEFARVLARRNLAFRARGVQLMLLCALVLRPLPPEVVDRIAEFARALSVDDGMIDVARRFADGALGLAAIDFERNGYTAAWHADDAASLHTSHELAGAWELAVADEELAQRWEALGDLPDGTLGRRVWQLYRARGFEFPGRPGSAPPLLAQHDWVHVLADYGTTVECELEVFAFIARANDDMRAFSLLAMVVSLFETGYLSRGAGLFESDLGHLSSSASVPVRMSDAMRRGALCSDCEAEGDSVDFLRIDWFELAPLSVDAVRSRFHVVTKSDAAVEAGSIGPCEPGGISPFQRDAGATLAERQGRPYESYGASVAP